MSGATAWYELTANAADMTARGIRDHLATTSNSFANLKPSEQSAIVSEIIKEWRQSWQGWNDDSMSMAQEAIIDPGATQEQGRDADLTLKLKLPIGLHSERSRLSTDSLESKELLTSTELRWLQLDRTTVVLASNMPNLPTGLLKKHRNVGNPSNLWHKFSHSSQPRFVYGVPLLSKDIESVSDIRKALGFDESHEKNIHLADLSVQEDRQYILDFDMHQAESFRRGFVHAAVSDKIIDLNKKLFAINNNENYDVSVAMECVALICRSLAASSRAVEAILPITVVESGINLFGGLISTTSGETILVPMSLSLIGRRPQFDLSVDDKTHMSWRRGWSRRPPTLRSFLGATQEAVKIGGLFNEQQIPILACRDIALMFHPKPHDQRLAFPRMFHETWMIHRGTLGDSRTVTQCLGLYSSLSCLMARILRVFPRIDASIRVGPFSVLKIEQLSFLEQPTADVPGEIKSWSDAGLRRSNDDIFVARCYAEYFHWRIESNFVNEIPKCELFDDCFEPCLKDSLYCRYHSSAIVDVFRVLGTDPERYVGKPTAAQVEWSFRALTHKDIDNLNSLSDDASTTWLIDAEFSTVKHYAPICWEIAISNVRGDVLLYHKIDYGMSFSEISDFAARHDIPKIFCVSEDVKSGRRRHLYLPIKEIRKKILDLGFSPKTHRILSWFSSVDGQCFARIMRGDENLLSPRINSEDLGDYFQPWSAFTTIKRMLPKCPIYQLGPLHEALCPNNKFFRYHFADVDAVALAQILQAARDALHKWEHGIEL